MASPFVDRRHGTERALAELLERLARDYGCTIHLYAQRVEDLRVEIPDACFNDGSAAKGDAGTIYWHRVPAIPGPHIVQFLGWMILNSLCRVWDVWFGGVSCDLLFSPGINCLRPDLVIVHVLFHRLRELSGESGREQVAPSPILRRWHRRLYYALLTVLESRVYRNRGTQVAAVSRRTADLVKHYCGRQDVAIVHNGVDLAQFREAERLARRNQARRNRGFRDEECVLLLIGNDWHTKGLPTILEAMAALRELPFRLLVVGSDAPEHFRTRAAQLGLLQRCSWESPQPDVLEFYAAADVYVSPTLEDAFSLPVPEAMACGLPTITSRFNGAAEMMRDGVDGFVVEDPRDVGTVARLLARLGADPELRRDTGAAAARRAADWSWDRHASIVWELLQRKA